MSGTRGHPNGKGIEGCAGLLTMYPRTPNAVGVALVSIYGITCAPTLAEAYRKLEAANDA